MVLSQKLLSALFFLGAATALPGGGGSKKQGGNGGRCPTVSGTFSIDQYQLYPESLDWDTEHCKLYLSGLFNSTLLIYDPATKSKEIISFPGISNNPIYHVSGINFDRPNNAMYVCANAGAPFVTLGADLSGPNKIIKLSTATHAVEWIADMAGFQADVQAKSGRFVSGFQDMDQDCRGNVYVPTTFGNAIARIPRSGGPVQTWYIQPDGDNTKLGMGSVAAVGGGSEALLVVDSATGRILNFDTRVAVNPTPLTVAVSGLPAGYHTLCDGIYIPAKYHSQVMLCADLFVGGTGAMVVYRSTDDWHTATYLGAIPNNDPLTATSAPTAAVQIGDSIFLNPIFLSDTPVFHTRGNRGSFPLIDITAKVAALVGS